MRLSPPHLKKALLTLICCDNISLQMLQYLKYMVFLINTDIAAHLVDKTFFKQLIYKHICALLFLVINLLLIKP